MHKILFTILFLWAGMVAADGKIVRAKEDSLGGLQTVNKENIVKIEIQDKLIGDKNSLGSGFYMREDLIITNFHVISEYFWNDKENKIIIYKGKDAEEVDLVHIDISRDIALLKVKKMRGMALKPYIGEIVHGQKLVAAGYPHNLGLVSAAGSYNGVAPQSIENYQRYLLSVTLNSGMSGGPTLNNNREVVGINVSSNGGQLSFIIPIIYAENLIKKYQEGGKYSGQNKIFLAKKQIERFNSTQIEQFKKSEKNQQGFGYSIWSTDGFLECWIDNKKSGGKNSYQILGSMCISPGKIYINDDKYLGKMEIESILFKNTKLSKLSFRKQIDKNMAKNQFKNLSRIKDAICNKQKVNALYINTCLQPVQGELPLVNLYVVILNLEDDRALVINSFFGGINNKQANEFIEHVLNQVGKS